ncbi:protein FATTY ACID EXPORT 1, chloroplastic-like [Zingiber officinale]|uniref:protein FATTY ACID EXPORT 1, chloroplastic-like n=1 Tax=Zingiber officinale TaxID=94328 RepID=UPI001C4A9CB0|nr:protein FATTY ACID EXPORT 1, chloroplastic-like [Zingiber officinale]
MASAQIYGPGLGMRSSMKPSLAAIRPSLPLRTMEFRIKCFKVPSVRVINISNRKFYVSMRANRRNSQSDFEASTDTIYPEDKFDKSESIESNPVVQEATAPTQKTARIHDFCLGIPYGGFLFFGGLLGFVLSRNPTGLIFGGVISALSIFSLIVWSSGGSSIPFILGQTAISVAFFWRHLQAYSSSKRFFPASLYLALSAAMVCFYSYVLLSGGNPPPKKLAKAKAPSS